MVLTVQGWGGRDDKDTGQDMAPPEGLIKMQLAGPSASWWTVVSTCCGQGPRVGVGEQNTQAGVALASPARPQLPQRWVSERGCITKHRRLSGSNSRNPLSLSSRGEKFKVKVQAGLVLSEGREEEPIACR